MAPSLELGHLRLSRPSLYTAGLGEVSLVGAVGVFLFSLGNLNLHEASKLLHEEVLAYAGITQRAGPLSFELTSV